MVFHESQTDSQIRRDLTLGGFTARGRVFVESLRRVVGRFCGKRQARKRGWQNTLKTATLGQGRPHPWPHNVEAQLSRRTAGVECGEFRPLLAWREMSHASMSPASVGRLRRKNSHSVRQEKEGGRTYPLKTATLNPFTYGAAFSWPHNDKAQLPGRNAGVECRAFRRFV